MGIGTSSQIPLPHQPDKNYMCIALSNVDSVVLFYPDEDIINTVRNAIASTWIYKIVRENYLLTGDGTIRNCYQFKLGGLPFRIEYNEKAKEVSVRLMSSAILQSLYMIGWKLLVSSDLSKRFDVTTWFFQRQQIFPDNSLIFSIGLTSADKILINGCPGNLHGMIKDVCQRSWVNGIQREDTSGNSYEIKLLGTPWFKVNKVESCSARLMLKNIIQALQTQHYMLYGNSNVKNNADTMFFQYNPSLQGEGDFIMVSLNRNDRLRLIGTPPSINEAIKGVVESFWPQRIHSVKEDASCYELRLNGYPWLSKGHDSVLCRLLIAKIMEMMASLGYFVIAALDITRKPGDKAVFLFQRGLSLRTSFMCVSFTGTDIIRFINAPQNIVQAGREIVHLWPKGLRSEKTFSDGVSYEATVAGNPWFRMKDGDGYQTRAILLRLLCKFISLGWRIVCSADVSAMYYRNKNSPDTPFDVHSWYFMYDEMMLSQMQKQ